MRLGKLRHCAEQTVTKGKSVPGECGCREVGLGGGEGCRVCIKTEETTAGLGRRQKRLGVSTTAKRAIKIDPAGHGSQGVQHFLKQHRQMVKSVRHARFQLNLGHCFSPYGILTPGDFDTDVFNERLFVKYSLSNGRP